MTIYPSIYQEWEEKYNALMRENEKHKKQVERLRASKYMEQARQGVSSVGKGYDSDRCDTNDFSSNIDSPRSARPSSIASMASLSHHAKSIVSTFSCTGEREFSDRHSKKSVNQRINPRMHQSSERSSVQHHRNLQYGTRR